MSTYRNNLPQLSADVFLTDGGIETTLIFDDGLELPDFAAFILLDDPVGREALVRYFDSYADDRGARPRRCRPRDRDMAGQPRLGSAAGLQPRAARRRRTATPSSSSVRPGGGTRRPTRPIVISGCIGPRGDGYQPGALMTAEEAAAYHSRQAAVFAEAGADLITAITMTYPAEAIGVTEAARAAEMPS